VDLRFAQAAERCYRSFAPVEWSESLRCWCVFDPALITAVLKSIDFVVVDSAEEYAKIEQRTRLCWTAAINALDHIPLANEGERHSRLRRDFAQLIGARSASAKMVVGEFVAKAVPQVFRERHSAELMHDLLRPITNAMFAELLGVPPPAFASAGPSASQIFDRFLRLNRRKVVQDEVIRLSKAFAENARELATSPEYATALMVVANSLLGSLATSLVALLRDGAGSRLCDLTYSEFLPRTGVPYVERVAKKDCAIDGFNFLAGNRVRLFLDAYPARGDVKREEPPYFGKGHHLCVGKDLSQWVWCTLVYELAKIPLHVRITEARLRSHDFAFNMYDSIEVSMMKVSGQGAPKSSGR
jgi:cytochrome P450